MEDDSIQYNFTNKCLMKNDIIWNQY